MVTLVDSDDRAVVLEISATAARAPDGRVTAAVVTFDDVTAREARERAEREFVTNAAHELRTPLTAIATAVEVLQSGAKEIPEERDLFLGHLERECRRLARLGTALLALARAQAQEEAPRTEVVALHEMLGEVGRELTVADTVEIRVDCARDVGTVSNRGLLDQAIWNLAANAAHHTIHGEIVLSGRLDGGRAIIEVRDSGPGIAPAARTAPLRPVLPRRGAARRQRLRARPLDRARVDPSRRRNADRRVRRRAPEPSRRSRFPSARLL